MLFENYLSSVWKFIITPPWMSVCGFGIIYNFAAIDSGSFILILLANGTTIIILVEHRMRSVISLIHRKIARIARFMKYFYTVTQFLVIFCFLLAYEDFREQTDYKLQLNETDGPIPNFIYCENCLVFKLDSQNTINFAISSTFSVLIAGNAILLMAFSSYYALSSNSAIFSKRTILVQKSFLQSLFIQIGVHMLFLAAPILFFFFAFLLRLSMEKWQIFMHFLTICFFQHGSFSTIAMLSTNKQLKRNLIQFFRKIRQRLNWSSNTEADNKLRNIFAV
ncbi:unnamed protein product [Caenorhabditis angaria]|uniref:Uncharacterized protein n=1 Tax=Caenorhabditis angaria TaxID=860376 RepID=A0A9P1N7E9_9PELO|nr:unnamed protein product [Caenorhabditis angaria]